MKFKRFRATNWLPHPSSYDVPWSLKACCDVIERDLAPSLFILTFCISAAAFHLLGALIFIVIILLMLWLMCGYTRGSRANVAGARILLYLVTLFLFVTLMGNDHAFNDSTLP